MASITGSMTIDEYPDLIFPLLISPTNLGHNQHRKEQSFDAQLEFATDDYMVLMWEPLLSYCENVWAGFAENLHHHILEYFEASPHLAAVESSSNYWSTLGAWCQFITSNYFRPCAEFNWDFHVRKLLKSPNYMYLRFN